MRTIVPYIAAVAAAGAAWTLTRPRTPRQWVEHCRSAAASAAAETRANPPIRELEEKSRATIRRWLYEMENPEGEALTTEYKQLTMREIEDEAHIAAASAFRREMPLLTSRGSTRAYIACVAAGTADRFFTAAESKSLMYTAQLALSAYKPGPSSRTKG